VFLNRLIGLDDWMIWDFVKAFFLELWESTGVVFLENANRNLVLRRFEKGVSFRKGLFIHATAD